MARQIAKVELVEILFRHKYKTILAPAIVIMLTAGIVLFLPRTYRSEARLFLQLGRESLAIDPAATTGPTANMIQSNREEEIKSALQVIGSRGVISQVVDRLGADYVLTGGGGNARQKPNPIVATLRTGLGKVVQALRSIDPVSDRERAIIAIERDFKVDAERNSMVLTASFDAESPELAQTILSALTEVYQAEHLRIHRNADSGAFLSDQRDLLREQYVKAQQTVKDAKNRFGIPSITGRRAHLEAQLQSIELQQIDSHQELITTEAHVRDLESQLTVVPEREQASAKSIPNEGADLLRKELYTNQLRLMEYQSRLIADHPLVVATGRQVDEGKRLLDEQVSQRQEVSDDINPVYRALALDRRQQASHVAGVTARSAELAQQHAALRQSLEQFSEQELELIQLEHDEQIARDKYLLYTNSLEQARMDEALEKRKISSVSVAQSATLAEKPVSPSKVLVGLGGLCMAMATAVGLVVISEKLNDKIRSEADLARSIGLPVLATLDESRLNSRVLLR